MRRLGLLNYLLPLFVLGCSTLNGNVHMFRVEDRHDRLPKQGFTLNYAYKSHLLTCSANPTEQQSLIQAGNGLVFNARKIQVDPIVVMEPPGRNSSVEIHLTPESRERWANFWNIEEAVSIAEQIPVRLSGTIQPYTGNPNIATRGANTFVGSTRSRGKYRDLELSGPIRIAALGMDAVITFKNLPYILKKDISEKKDIEIRSVVTLQALLKKIGIGRNNCQLQAASNPAVAPIAHNIIQNLLDAHKQSKQAYLAYHQKDAKDEAKTAAVLSGRSAYLRAKTLYPELVARCPGDQTIPPELCGSSGYIRKAIIALDAARVSGERTTSVKPAQDKIHKSDLKTIRDELGKAATAMRELMLQPGTFKLLVGFARPVEHERYSRLFGPWYNSHKDFGTKGNSSLYVRRGDPFTLYFNEAFFKYMPDFGGVNEVMVVFRFREGGSEKDEFVKIIGPMRRLADGSFASQIGKITYGPKILEGDSLSVNIQVIEYDADERESRGAFLDFVGNAVQTFNLSNPLTAGEAKLAKEVAKTINDLDQNDIILEYEFDILPADKSGTVTPRNSKAIPFRVGHYGLIKQEIRRWDQKPIPALRHVWSNNSDNCLTWMYAFALSIPAFFADLGFGVVSLFRAPFTDTPDTNSTSDIVRDRDQAFLKDNGVAVLFESSSRRLYEGADSSRAKSTGEVYDRKTWLTFSIEKGRDPTLWQIRKKLGKAEEKLIASLQSRSVSDVLSGSGVLNAIRELQEIREQFESYRVIGFVADEKCKVGGTPKNCLTISIRYPAKKDTVETVTISTPGDRVYSFASSERYKADDTGYHGSFQSKAHVLTMQIKDYTASNGKYRVDIQRKSKPGKGSGEPERKWLSFDVDKNGKILPGQGSR